jgi:hypothetical protein
MDNSIHVKREIQLPSTSPAGFPGRESVTVVDLCSSDDDSDIGEVAGGLEKVGNNFVGLKRGRDTFGGSSEVDRNNVKKVTTLAELGVGLPEGFGQSNPPESLTHPIPANPCNVFRPVPPPPPPPYAGTSGKIGGCKQFWKAGDYEGAAGDNWDLSSGGFDHVRVHPKFLHSNATSHKWALGAFAELLDNALDEVGFCFFTCLRQIV